MAILAPGTQQNRWRRMGSAAGSAPAMPDIGAYAYRETLPIGYDFGWNWTIEVNPYPQPEPPEPRIPADMCCALRFYFVKATETVPPAIARIWGVSKAHLLGETDEAFLGTYLGQVGFNVGTSNGLPIDEDPFDTYKNVLLDNSYIASRVVVQDDRALSPPGLRVVGNSNAGSGRSPFVLFDAMGFDRIVVSLRYTDTYGSNGLGVFWTTM